MSTRPGLDQRGLDTGKKARLHRILHEHGLRNGTAIFLPYDQGLEHGPRDFFANPDASDPRYIVRLAVEGGFNGARSTLLLMRLRAALQSSGLDGLAADSRVGGYPVQAGRDDALWPPARELGQAGLDALQPGQEWLDLGLTAGSRRPCMPPTVTRT